MPVGQLCSLREAMRAPHPTSHPASLEEEEDVMGRKESSVWSCVDAAENCSLYLHPVDGVGVGGVLSWPGASAKQ